MANIIQQFKNANGDNIFPLAYAQGGCKLDLLWTNPNPTSDFSAQTISLDISAYEYVIISVRGYKGSGETFEAVSNNLCSIDYGNCNLVTMHNDVVTSRRATITNSSITFSTGNYNQGNHGTGTGTAYAIPVHIYGIKMSYIVPTSVHGLQYVEV